MDALIRCFWALYPETPALIPDSFLSTVDLASEAAQNILVANLLGDKDPWLGINQDEFTSYTSVLLWRRAFWRRLVRFMENNYSLGDDSEPDGSSKHIHEAILTELANLMGLPIEPSSHVLKVRSWGPSSAILLQEASTITSGGTTGLRTWKAAPSFANALPGLLQKNGTILELGSGTGFLSLFLEKLSPLTIHATDIGQPLLQLFKNAQLNGSGILISELDWFSDTEVWDQWYTSHISNGIDVIIASDVVYDPDLVEPLVRTLKFLFSKSPHAVMYLCATLRQETTWDLFVLKCAESSIHIENEPLERKVDFAGYQRWDGEGESFLVKLWAKGK